MNIIKKNRFFSCIIFLLIVVIGVIYGNEFKIFSGETSIANNYEFDRILGIFIWEYRGFEMIIIAFIFLSTIAGISILTEQSIIEERKNE